MHIVYVPESFPQPSETFVINEIDGLLGMGYQITVVPRIKGDLDNTKHARLNRIMQKIKVVYKSGGFNFSAFLYGLKYGGQVWQGWRLSKLIKHIKNAGEISKHVSAIQLQKPDLVLIHFGYDNALAGVVAAKLLKIPVFLWMHGSDMYTVPHRSLVWLTERASHVITNSDYSANLLVNLGVLGNLTVSRLGVDTGKFNQPLSNIKEHNPTLICIARLGHNKNHQQLILVFQQILEKIPSAKLWLVGDGPNRQLCESLVSNKNKEKIVFFGALPQEELIDLLQRSWVKVLLSEKEGLGVALIEAHAVGLPCVASSVGGIPEVIKINETGFLFDLKDPEFNQKVGNSIVELLSNDVLRNKMGNAARLRAETDFDEKLHIQRMDKLIKRIMDEKK